MPKIKTRRSINKRIKVTGTGKLIRKRSGKSHILTKKRRKRKRRLKKDVPVDKSYDRKVRRGLPYL